MAVTLGFGLLVGGGVVAADRMVALRWRTGLSIDDGTVFRTVIKDCLKHINPASIGLMVLAMLLVSKATGGLVSLMGGSWMLATIAEGLTMAGVAFGLRYRAGRLAIATHLPDVLERLERCRACGYQLSGVEIRCPECQNYCGPARPPR